MNKRLAALIVAGVVLVGGALFYMAMRDDGDSAASTESNNQNETTQEETNGENFSPLDMMDTAFEATVEGTDENGNAYEMLLQYDGEGRSRMAGEQDGTRFETIFTSDAFYSCEGNNCIEFPVSQTESAPFQPGEYVYEDEDFSDFRDTASYKGRGECPAGTCDIWEVTEDGYTSTLYIDSNQRISQVQGTDGGSTFTITYEYKNVSIDIPANAQTIPALEQ